MARVALQVAFEDEAISDEKVRKRLYDHAIELQARLTLDFVWFPKDWLGIGWGLDALSTGPFGPVKTMWSSTDSLSVLNEESAA